jgi:acetyl esterase/lipase
MSTPRFLAKALGTTARVVAGRLVGKRGRPSWSLKTQLLVGAARAAFDSVEHSAEGVRWLRGFQAKSSPKTAVQDQVRFEEVDAGGVPCVWCTMPGASGDEPVLVYCHGGAYVIGGVDSFRDFIARLTLATGARVLAVDYRVGPEAPFPAPQEDCLGAYRWLLDDGVAPAKIALTGDSAGAALCVAALLMARDRGLPQPAGAALMCPWVDPAADGGSIVENDATDIASRAFMLFCVEQVRGEADLDEPLLAPLHADLKGLAPLLVHAGEAEMGLDSITEFAQRAKTAGVDVEQKTFPDMFHVFHAVAGLPEAETAVSELAEWLQARW